MRDKIREFTIAGGSWGDIRVLRPLPLKGDPWGVLAPLRDTFLKGYIPEVPGDTFSNALYGHVRPLLDHLGTPPAALLKRVPEAHRRCENAKKCISVGDNCQPGPKTPDCFVMPGLPEAAQVPANIVILAWREGRYVLVVTGPEFTL